MALLSPALTLKYLVSLNFLEPKGRGFSSKKSILLRIFLRKTSGNLRNYFSALGTISTIYPNYSPRSFRNSLNGLPLSLALFSAMAISIRSSLRRLSLIISIRNTFCSFFGIVRKAVKKTFAVIPCPFMCLTSLCSLFCQFQLFVYYIIYYSTECKMYGLY